MHEVVTKTTFYPLLLKKYHMLIVGYNIRHQVNKCFVLVFSVLRLGTLKSRRKFSNHLTQAHYFTDEKCSLKRSWTR